MSDKCSANEENSHYPSANSESPPIQHSRLLTRQSWCKGESRNQRIWSALMLRKGELNSRLLFSK